VCLLLHGERAGSGVTSAPPRTARVRRLDLGTGGDPLHVAAEHVREEAIVLVPALVTDRLSEQAR
jgi:hypothetical protein